MNKVINDIAMHRKDYTKPTMTIVPLKQRSLIICGSPEAKVLHGNAKTETEEEIWYELQ